ncbi:MFS transporter [Nocardia sp. NPDC049190]|uniref:MFS transporter n=1 Tax=Nocardia sp. NPDC049190 TaxID=3155650 RepID=UPI0033D8C689
MAARAVLFRSIGELIPLYALYALLFADHGMSSGQISLLFAIWSVTSFLLEVPSGAWADTVSRRALLALSGVLLTGGFTLWTVVPSFPGFAAGFVLWGISGALASGTFEALLYDELVARGESAAYPRILGYTRAGAEGAVVVAIVVATPLYLWGGYPFVGWSSVAMAALHSGLALSLPTAPKVVSAVDIDELENENSVPRGEHARPTGGAATVPTSAEPIASALRGGAAVLAAAAADRDPGASVHDAVSDLGGRAMVRDVDSAGADEGAIDVDDRAVVGVRAVHGGRVASRAAVPGSRTGAAGRGAVDGLVVGAEVVTSDAASDLDVARPRDIARPRPFARYLGMLTAGVREAVRVRAVRYGVLLEGLLLGMTAFDEYFALLADEAGVSTAVVPLLVGITVLGSLIGAVLAGRTEGISGRTMAAAVGVAGVLFLGGALIVGVASHRPGAVYLLTGLGFTAIGVSYGIVYNAGVVAGARLQAAIEGPARATVTSVSGLLGEMVALVVFAVAAVVTRWTSVSTLLALFGAVMLALAVCTPRWLPR